jgi:hypothetical protein
MGDCPSHLSISHFKCGDVKEAEAAAISAHLTSCERCSALSLSMDANIADFEKRSALKVKDLMDTLDKEPVSLAAKQSTAKKAATVGVLFAAAAAALLIMIFGIYKPSESKNDADIHFKGAFTVEVVADRGGSQFAVKNGVSLAKGDAIRFIVTADRPGYLMVFSKDSKGVVSPFYPDTEPSVDSKPWNVNAAGRQELPGSIVLNDAVGKEQFVVIFSPREFSRSEAHQKWNSLKNPDNPSALGKDFFVQTITVQKEPADKR